MENINLTVDKLVEWLKEKVKEAKAEGLVFGLSGGIDSAVIAGIAKKAFPDNSLGIIMPCHSDPIDEEHGVLVAEKLNLKTARVDLSNSFDVLLNSMTVENKNKMAISNLKPRLRMTTLYYFAQNNNYLVVGSSNKSEFTVGYFTKHGDSGVDLLPLASFVKSEIRELAKVLGIPDIIIEKPPTAGLWANQTDESEMGFSYNILDNYIKTGEGPKEIVEKIKRMNTISEHKRVYPPIFRK
ncbi:NAD(+) synthase [Tissierella carlieri]|jgi:NAD+ synthase|uniref:NAD(+) synthase n=1 Tax=Tissierella TaxID=41273 RepID=UPI001C1044FF|nr:NAD(+) synthase [Tissierella carlieri]MBU5313555.1 NAD(+) synthase [Tissierella carlieri]MDU5083079.1 NAD(+) synthase [Bacillota bacterium]